MAKIIGIMQPYLFPYLQYWQLIQAVDTFVIYDDVQYIKNGWINRNNILLNNNAHLITLPLEGASSNKNINEISVVKNEVLKQKLLKTMTVAYKKAPNFEMIYNIIEKTLFSDDQCISSVNTYAIKEICNYLDINTEIIISSDIEKDNNLKAQDKVIHITQLLNGTDYINVIGGSELYSKEDFAKNGLVLHFLKGNFKPYTQFGKEFVKGLSIIDILMFNSKEQVKEMFDDYELL